jgi:lysophospholipase L1-like esterase
MASKKLAFQTFDQTASRGGMLNVVFLGGSLTWGANATDPQLFSYRAHLMRKFQERYPHAPLRYWDTSIGGQGSQLAVFRLNRDVLSRQPDLLFLEFAVNDGPSETDEERLASYEALVRRVIREAACPIIISILAVREDVIGAPMQRPRHAAHEKIAAAYNCGLALTVPWIRKQVGSGRVKIENLWANPNWPNPKDVTHPGNRGYELFAEVIWQAFAEAVKKKYVCRLPEQMLYPATYLKAARSSLAALPVPAGWKKGQPNRVSIAYDFLMSRWLDEMLIAQRSEGAPTPSSLTIPFHGATAFFFGEATSQSGKYRVSIDGKPSSIRSANAVLEPGVFDASSPLGNGPLVQLVAQGLNPEPEHTLTIEPLLEPGQELKLESLCVAG